MTDKIKGVVEHISEERGGISIGGIWYNAVKDSDVRSRIVKELRDSEVELTLIGPDRTLFTDLLNLGKVKIKRPFDTRPPAMFKEDYWGLRDKKDSDRDRRIGRASGLNTAIEILKAGKFEGTPQEYLKEAKLYAENISKWVNNIEDETK